MTRVRMLTFRTAAKAAGCTVRTLHNWKTAGMVTHLDERGRRIVAEDELMMHKRIHLRANPAHRYRMRRAEAEECDTPSG